MLHYLLTFSFFQKIWSWLNQWDTDLFLQINTRWTNRFLDSVFPWWRDANTWIPLYLFLVVFALMNFKKKAFPWILFALVTVVLTDQCSSTLLKHWVARPRPCQEGFLIGQMRLLLSGCSGGYSFTSSHATNHFGFATFVYLTTRSVLGRWGKLFFIWAATISYGQVYVGVHYPLDVLCGALLGCCIGYVTAYFFNQKIGLPSFSEEPSTPAV
jgi:undecaprenyl-diphosphatase